MAATKKKVTVTLDADLVEELDTINGSLSAQVNAALRETVEQQRRRRALDELVRDWEAEDGPPDEALVQEYMDLLR